MAGRGRGRGRAARQQTPDHEEGSQPAPTTPPQPLPTQSKRRTIADNYRAIESIESQLAGVTRLLSNISERLPNNPTDPQTVHNHTPCEPTANFESSFNFSSSPTRHHDQTPHQAYPGPHRARHATQPTHPYRASSLRDPLGPGPHARHLPANLQAFEDDAGLQQRVAHYLTASLAPLHGHGKKVFPHSYVTRGIKRTKTTLGELSLPEYNMGYMRLMNSKEVDSADRSHMYKHLEAVNEDAVLYDWADVRAWSEECCARVADPDSDLVWSDYYSIDLLRLKLSQANRASRQHQEMPRDSCTFEGLSDVTTEVKAARPAPPCRHFNAGACTSRSHHVVNGFRYLHICAYCITNKCSFLPHSEKDCRSKDFKKKPREPELGFGK